MVQRDGKGTELIIFMIHPYYYTQYKQWSYAMFEMVEILTLNLLDNHDILHQVLMNLKMELKASPVPSFYRYVVYEIWYSLKII
jgi:hypothetical protein